MNSIKITRKRPRIATYGSNADEYLNDDSRYAPQARTDYAVALLNPFKMMPVRIPDLSCFPTTVYNHSRNFTWSVNSTSTTANTQMIAVFFGQNTLSQFYQGDNSPNFGQMTGNTWTPSILEDSLVSRIYMTRLVTAGVRIKYTGNDQENQGTITVKPLSRAEAYATANWTNAAPLGLVNMSSLQGEPQAYMGPAANGAVYRYQPSDSASFAMNGTLDTSVTLAGQYYFGGVLIGMSGVDTAATFIVEIAATYEGIPNSTNKGLLSAKGPADPVAQAYGMDIAGRSSAAFSAASEKVNIEGPIRQVLKY